jgi:carbonic anhydrase
MAGHADRPDGEARMGEDDRALSRRSFLRKAGAAGGGAVLGGELLGGALTDLADARGAYARPATPDAALKALVEGNRRYRTGRWTRRDYSPVGERRAVAQQPFAAILACADSRVSPPLAFDVERGNLFAAHVAGNSADVGSTGSLEYAVAVLGVHVIMVLGHSDCGAVKAAIEVAAGKKSYPESKYGSIGAVVDAVVPAVAGLDASARTLQASIVANARRQAKLLEQTGPIIPAAIAAGTLRVVAAVYDIGSGTVHLV